MYTTTPPAERRALAVAARALHRAGYVPPPGRRPGRFDELVAELLDAYVAAGEQRAAAYGPGLGLGPDIVPGPAELLVALRVHAQAAVNWQLLDAWEDGLPVAVTVEPAEVDGDLLGVVARGYAGDRAVASEVAALPAAGTPLQLWRALELAAQVDGAAIRAGEAAVAAARTDQEAGRS